MTEAEDIHALWSAVVYQAFIDATYAGRNMELVRAKRDADRWIRLNDEDYREVCSLASMDPDFLRDAYMSGRVDPKRLRASERAEQ